MTYIEDMGYGAGWVLFSEDAERAVLVGVPKAEADYGLMLLEAGVNPDDIEEMTTPTECGICNGVVFFAQLDTSGRCPDCQS